MAADELLVVTAPEPASITDGYALIKAVSRRRAMDRSTLSATRRPHWPRDRRLASGLRMYA